MAASERATAVSREYALGMVHDLKNMDETEFVNKYIPEGSTIELTVFRDTAQVEKVTAPLDRHEYNVTFHSEEKAVFANRYDYSEYGITVLDKEVVDAVMMVFQDNVKVILDRIGETGRNMEE